MFLVVYDKNDFEFVEESELWSHIGAWLRADCVVFNLETKQEENVGDYSHLYH